MKTSKERTASILQKAEAKRRTRKKIKIISILSGVAAALLAFNLVLFVPYTVGDADITKYSSSQYYGVIQKLYGLTYSPRKTNNFTEWGITDWLDGMFATGSSAPGDASSPPTNSGMSGEINNSYQETTLNQTDGVIEGDLFKRSDTHIFYLGMTYGNYGVAIDHNGQNATLVDGSDTLTLRVYSIDAEQSEQATSYTISPDKNMLLNGFTREMYLSEDLKTVTVITQNFEYDTRLLYTTVINVDVSDLSHITETNRTYISGSYVSSRVVNGKMLVITDFAVRGNVDFGSLPQYVPQVGGLDDLKPLLAEDIVCPDNANTARYTVISSLDSNLEPMDSVALLSFSDDVYVSKNNLFATREYRKTVKTDNEYRLTYTRDETEIRIVPYDNGEFGETRSVTTAGAVLNRYSLDEYAGVLRAVTTVHFLGNEYVIDKNAPDQYAGVFRSRCMLYCYDLDTLEEAGKVVDFAPLGESVRSARFDGDTAYVCTAEVRIINTDPVYAFDLSDYAHITYKDTGTIPGYSLSLNNFAFGTLLGIGYGDTQRTLKIELYEQTDSDVTSVAKYEEDNVNFSSEFKAHLIDAKNGIIGLGIRSFGEEGTRYAIFRYDGYNIIKIASVKMDSTRTDEMRACFVDGYVYIFEECGQGEAKGLKVVKIN